MEPGEALTTAAQIAVALAGFAGVVVAFRSSSLHEWSLLDKFRLWLLLGSALAPLLSCLFGMLLLTIKPTPFPIWRWCSGFSLLLICIFGFLSRRRQSEHDGEAHDPTPLRLHPPATPATPTSCSKIPLAASCSITASACSPSAPSSFAASSTESRSKQ